VYSSVLECFFNKLYRKRKINIKRYTYLNWRGFYSFLNYHTQHRTGVNMTRSYLINSKLWYFQKKKTIRLPFIWKKSEFINIENPVLKFSLVSKLNDFIKEIF
jgi:hypothetical protein